MSLGLRLRARFPQPGMQPEVLLKLLEGWLSDKFAVMRPQIRRSEGEDALSLFCRMHPAAEEIEFSLTTACELITEANTTTVGPGYHVFVCELLQGIEREFGAKWEQSKEGDDDFIDETGYFFSQDRKALEDEMLQWLRAIAGLFFDGSLDGDAQGTALCLPMNVRFEANATALTPLGPRDLEWLRQTAEDPRRGTDFWAWHEPGFTADFYRRRALAHMWTDVRWRTPVNEQEKQTLDDVADCLKRAYEIDPALEYPWAEWQDILTLAGRAGPEADIVNAHSLGAATIGYRRGIVVTTLPGGWTIRTRGAFSEFGLDEQGDLCALDPPREIWFTAYQVRGVGNAKQFRRSIKQMRDGGADYELERDGYYSHAFLSQKQNDRGESRLILHTVSAAIGIRCVCTILSAAADKDWALATWRSIQPPANKPN